MGWITISLGVLTIALSYYTDSSLLWLSVITTVILFLSYMIVHNSAVETAKMKRDYYIEMRENNGADINEINILKQMPLRLSPGDAGNAPKYPSAIFMASSVLIFILFLISAYQAIK